MKNIAPIDSKIPEIDIIYRNKMKISLLPRAKHSQDVYDILLNHWNHDHICLMEEFKILLLNRANRVLGIVNLSKGGFTGTVVDLRLLFAIALKAAAVQIVVAHNHPSGNLTPSKQDLEMTDRIKEAGKILEIKLIDHLIITVEQYYSFADNGRL